MHFACRVEEVDKMREKEGGPIFKGIVSLPNFSFFLKPGENAGKNPCDHPI